MASLIFHPLQEMSCGHFLRPKTFYLTRVSFTPKRPRGILSRDRSGVKVGLSKGSLFYRTHNPMLFTFGVKLMGSGQLSHLFYYILSVKFIKLNLLQTRPFSFHQQPYANGTKHQADLPTAGFSLASRLFSCAGSSMKNRYLFSSSTSVIIV